MRTGGWADKLGNRYEGRWTAKQFLLLLAEKLQMVQLETEDSVEQRVDLLVVPRTSGLPVYREACETRAYLAH
jgi:hypothetical protein